MFALKTVPEVLHAHDVETLVKIFIQQSIGAGICNINYIANLMNTSKIKGK